MEEETHPVVPVVGRLRQDAVQHEPAGDQWQDQCRTGRTPGGDEGGHDESVDPGPPVLRQPDDRVVFARISVLRPRGPVLMKEQILVILGRRHAVLVESYKYSPPTSFFWPEQRDAVGCRYPCSALFVAVTTQHDLVDHVEGSPEAGYPGRFGRDELVEPEQTAQVVLLDPASPPRLDTLASLNGREQLDHAWSRGEAKQQAVKWCGRQCLAESDVSALLSRTGNVCVWLTIPGDAMAVCRAA